MSTSTSQSLGPRWLHSVETRVRPVTWGGLWLWHSASLTPCLPKYRRTLSKGHMLLSINWFLIVTFSSGWWGQGNNLQNHKLQNHKAAAVSCHVRGTQVARCCHSLSCSWNGETENNHLRPAVLRKPIFKPNAIRWGRMAEQWAASRISRLFRLVCVGTYLQKYRAEGGFMYCESHWAQKHISKRLTETCYGWKGKKIDFWL